jgi:hypothetical protein
VKPGKLYAMQCHVHWRLRATRPIPRGRQIDSISNFGTR